MPTNSSAVDRNTAQALGSSTMTRPYLVYVNGILATRRMTLKFAIKDAMRFFPSYIKDERTNVIVWNGGK